MRHTQVLQPANPLMGDRQSELARLLTRTKTRKVGGLDAQPRTSCVSDGGARIRDRRRIKPKSPVKARLSLGGRDLRPLLLPHPRESRKSRF